MDEFRLKKILNSSPDMYLIVDQNGVLLDFSPSLNFKPILPPEEFLGKSLKEVLPDGLADTALIKIRGVLETGGEGLMEYTLSTDGTPCFYEARITNFDESQVLIIIRDVTDRKSSLEAAQSLINASGDIFLLLDMQGQIMSLNNSAAEVYGKTPEQMRGTSCWDHLPPEKALFSKEKLKKILQSGKPTLFLDRTDGKVFEVSCNPVREPTGDIRQLAIFIKDITDKAQAEQELIDSEARYRRLFDENPVPMYIYDTDTLRILDANPAMIRGYGYTKEELTSLTISEIRPPEDVSKVMENVKDLASKQVYLGLWRHTKKDGSVIDVEITSSDFPFLDRPARLVLCNDVTEKERIRRALEEKEQQYRHLFEHSPIPMFIFDPESLQILNVNLAVVDQYGYGKEDLLRMTIKDIRPPEDVKQLLKTMKEKSDSVEKAGVFRHLKRDGTVMLMDISSHDIFYEGRKARLALCNDVTERLRIKEQLEESEEKFRTAFITSPDSVNLTRLEDGKYVEVNDGFLQLTGYTREEVIGRTSFEINIWVEPGDREMLADRLRNNGYVNNLEARFRIKDGTIRNGLLSAKILHIKGQPHVLSMTRDITDLKLIQHSLAESEEKFRKAFITNPDPMTISQLEDGLILEVNDGFVETTGYSREECLGKSTLDLDLWVDEGQREEMTARLKEDGRIENFEVSMKVRDGTIRNALVSATIIRIGNVPRMLTISRDITDLKNVEKALLKSEEQLRASLREKEILLKEIHHRVKNNLQVISGLLDLQSHHLKSREDRELFKESRNRIATMALIHEDLYRRVNLSQVDFADYVRNLCENLMVSYGVDESRIKLRIEAENAVMVVDTAIPCGLIINELVTNSLKHAFPGERTGTISISFRQLKDSDYLLVVSDDGIGISERIDIDNTDTLGMHLVNIMTSQLGGTMEIRREGGTAFAIRFSEYHEAGSILY